MVDQTQQAFNLEDTPPPAEDNQSLFGYTAEGVQQEAEKYAKDFTEDDASSLETAASYLVPYYDSGVNIANVVEEYLKPEEERDYDYIKSQFKEAGQSAAIETGLLLMGGIATKYGAKGIKALAKKARQYEVDPNSMSAFGVGAIKKKVDEVELPPAENAARTQISGTLPTYKKADTLLTELAGDGKTLDFGAGLGLSKKELGFDTYEPFPKGDFTPDFTSPDKIPSNSYKKITNLNVLNVVPREVRDGIVKDIGRILEPNGTAVITTRGRDVMAAKGKAGPEPMSIITSKDTYQKGFTQIELNDYISKILGDGFTIIDNKLGAAGVTVQKLATKNFSEGGAAMGKQTEMAFMQKGGIKDDGMKKDPVSGNPIPAGSMAKEVRDDIPAMLSEGEYVVPADVLRFYGVNYFEDLRNKAKSGLQNMEANGRIGGEPVSPQQAQQNMGKAPMQANQGGTVGGFDNGGLQAPGTSTFSAPNNYLTPGGSSYPQGNTPVGGASDSIVTFKTFVHATTGDQKVIQYMDGKLSNPSDAQYTSAPYYELGSAALKNAQNAPKESSGGGGNDDPPPTPTPTPFGEDVDWSDPNAYADSIMEEGFGIGRTAGALSAVLGPVGMLGAGIINTGSELKAISSLQSARIIAQAQGLDTAAIDAHIKTALGQSSNISVVLNNLGGKGMSGAMEVLERLGMSGGTEKDKDGNPIFTPEQIASNRKITTTSGKKPVVKPKVATVTTSDKFKDAKTAQIKAASSYKADSDESNSVSLGQGTAEQVQASRDRADASREAVSRASQMEGGVNRENVEAAGGTWNTGGRYKGGLMTRKKTKKKKK